MIVYYVKDKGEYGTNSFLMMLEIKYLERSRPCFQRHYLESNKLQHAQS